MPSVPLPASGGYIQAVRESSEAVRIKANIKINEEDMTRLLLSPAFTSTYQRLRTAHGMTLPLNFSSVAQELNVLSVLSVLNFASGYRVPLHVATGRGAFDNIRAFVFAAHISSSSGEDDYFSARGMQAITPPAVADLMRVTGSIHVERPHEDIPGVTVGELGGPIWEIVQIVARTLNETGAALAQGGYPDLGSFVLEALKEGEKAKASGGDACDVALERLVRCIPAFRDAAPVYDAPVYCFKKALLTLHAVALRFGPAGKTPTRAVPAPDTTRLPIFSDNVIPSLLVHLGVLDLSAADPALGLPALFPHARDPAVLAPLLAASPAPAPAEVLAQMPAKAKEPPKEGPRVTQAQAFALRGAAIDVCERLVAHGRTLAAGADPELAWLGELMPPELDAWLWAVAKDRPDYRRLERFALTGTAYF
ncbi:uncharacterized protein BXZ73DRAFT_102154 [Epithele typhae]|uniref:uncharacterized protein n=1 Tax=Epithele typhae TaxID=378194 RepID=UPI002007C389|nr:uncharacterized protein BXZ73DRAFT_102154 [Epithele typhae]KAH9929630.1 hypothetical protein BXZ73DRAFT_102154 [Epithele typhae]